MLKSILTTLLAFVAVTSANATLSPGANLAPYEIHNTASGEDYCQMCAYGSKPATIAAYGKLGDAAFWADLEKLEALHKQYASAGFFAQVLDSRDAAAIQVEAKKHGITFPVVYAVEPDWDDVYKVEGVSRTVYYSKEFKVAWSSVGLDENSLSAIQSSLDNDAKG